MPVLNTIGGGSLGSYGRGRGRVDLGPAVPANVILPWNANSVVMAAPPGWSKYTGFSDRLILGTSTPEEVGITGSGGGTATITASTGGSGSHLLTGLSADAARESPPLNPDPFGSSQVYNQTSGLHTHTASGSINVSDVLPNTISTPFLTTTSPRSMLPPNVVVFKSTAPSWPSHFDYRPSGSGYFYGSNIPSWQSRRTPKTITTAGSGSHGHSNGTTLTNYYVFNGLARRGVVDGSHTHTLTVGVTAAVKSKMLKPWISQLAQFIEVGMILMYNGNLEELPLGWVVCNGTNGTVDMTDYFLGYSTTEIHDSIISSSNTVTSSVQSGEGVSQINWFHPNVSEQLNLSRGNPIYHGANTTSGAVHSHTVTSLTTTDVVNYTPPFRKIAFIEYRGT